MVEKIKRTLDYKEDDIHYYLLLLSAPVLLTIYRYFGVSRNYISYFPDFKSLEFGNVFTHEFQFFGFFILTFLIPVLHIFLWRGKRFSDFGFSLGDQPYGWRFVGLFFVFIVLPFSILGSFNECVTSEYPMAREIITHHQYIFCYELVYVMFYYVAWEFFFRGYLLFGLEQKYGTMAAILIQTISSCLVHIDKPFGEIMLSIPFGMCMGYVAIRTGSFWYTFLVHAALGVCTDLFIIYFHH